MRKTIDQTLAAPIGRKDGAAVLSMMRMPHLVDGAGMFPMMMVSLCISYSIHLFLDSFGYFWILLSMFCLDTYGYGQSIRCAGIDTRL